ncbi:hypothetical protein PS854_01628 [Pseudomonas fluorescens]|jgi:hypothetical protein|uniref:Uncharacterized protein n=1 Tax=Pseudomonas fluorescens TaxID=294 RepID=A0A5E7J2L9_PSEFL|nr:hypothetical protein PS854_01628 [Pseudomonas fluorescens]
MFEQTLIVIGQSLLSVKRSQSKNTPLIDF